MESDLNRSATEVQHSHHCRRVLQHTCQQRTCRPSVPADTRWLKNMPLSLIHNFWILPFLRFQWPVTVFNGSGPNLACGLPIVCEWSGMGYFCWETARHPSTKGSFRMPHVEAAAAAISQGQRVARRCCHTTEAIKAITAAVVAALV